MGVEGKAQKGCRCYAIPPAGCGRLLASWEPVNGPSKPSPVAAQFTSEGSTVSGADVELVGNSYRMSLVKKRFATGKVIQPQDGAQLELALPGGHFIEG